MNLEDHFGDVVKKGRAAAGVDAAAAAAVAGLTLDEWKGLEETGQFSKPLDFARLAPVLHMDANKLQDLAKGWKPAEVDLSQWREFRQISTMAGGNTVNCYLAWDEVTREAALFDTGWEALPVLQLLADNELDLRHLFLTHLHEDHLAAMGPIREKFPKLHLHTNSKTAPPQHRNRANDFLHLGSLRITNRETPGHAEEGVTYIIGNWPDDAPHVAIVGDTIFAGSMGRGNQSWELARQKIREQILSLPPATLLCPGHGPVTTVAEETAHNPFF